MAEIQSVFLEAMAAATSTAFHLEMRDHYGVTVEAEDFARWQQTGERDMDPASEYWSDFIRLVRVALDRGVELRRARIVSEPVSDYIRFEHAGTSVNIAAGEQVRWLSRSQASDLMLPGNDFWVFDATTVIFNHFTGSGDWADPSMELRTELAVAKLCADAFEAVWSRATPHAEFHI